MLGRPLGVALVLSLALYTLSSLYSSIHPPAIQLSLRALGLACALCAQVALHRRSTRASSSGGRVLSIERLRSNASARGLLLSSPLIAQEPLDRQVESPARRALTHSKIELERRDVSVLALLLARTLLDSVDASAISSARSGSIQASAFALDLNAAAFLALLLAVEHSSSSSSLARGAGSASSNERRSPGATSSLSATTALVLALCSLVNLTVVRTVHTNVGTPRALLRTALDALLLLGLRWHSSNTSSSSSSSSSFLMRDLSGKAAAATRRTVILAVYPSYVLTALGTITTTLLAGVLLGIRPRFNDALTHYCAGDILAFVALPGSLALASTLCLRLMRERSSTSSPSSSPAPMSQRQNLSTAATIDAASSSSSQGTATASLAPSILSILATRAWLACTLATLGPGAGFAPLRALRLALSMGGVLPFVVLTSMRHATALELAQAASLKLTSVLLRRAPSSSSAASSLEAQDNGKSETGDDAHKAGATRWSPLSLVIHAAYALSVLAVLSHPRAPAIHSEVSGPTKRLPPVLDIVVAHYDEDPLDVAAYLRAVRARAKALIGPTGRRHHARLERAAPLPARDRRVVEDHDGRLHVVRDAAASGAELGGRAPREEEEGDGGDDLRLWIYHKGGNGTILDALASALALRPGWDRVERLENVGREGHAYLHHLDKLYDATARELAGEVTSEAAEEQDTMAPWTMFLQAHVQWDWVMARRLEALMIQPHLTRAAAAHTGFLSLGPWLTNRGGQEDAQRVGGGGDYAGVRSVWNVLGRSAPYEQLSTWAGQFVISRERAVSRNPRTVYSRLLAMLEASDDDPITKMWAPKNASGRANPPFGHSLERSWPVIFGCEDPRIASRCPPCSWRVNECQCLD